MTKEELQKEAIYNIKVDTLQTVLPLSKEDIENKIMPVFYDLFDVFLDISGHIQKTIERVNRPIVVKSDKFVMEKFVDKACEWLDPVFKDLAGYDCGGDLIKDFKKAMEE